MEKITVRNWSHVSVLLCCREKGEKVYLQRLPLLLPDVADVAQVLFPRRGPLKEQGAHRLALHALDTWLPLLLELLLQISHLLQNPLLCDGWN